MSLGVLAECRRTSQLSTQLSPQSLPTQHSEAQRNPTLAAAAAAAAAAKPPHLFIHVAGCSTSLLLLLNKVI
jgi:hypothetical protein